MSFRQRHALPSDVGATDDLWVIGDSPDLLVEGATQPVPVTPEVRPSDQYVTIDERVEGVVGVVAADWPMVDSGGLRFSGAISSAWFDESDLQATVDRLRGAADQLARPLRIGDSFWVRGYTASSTGDWEDLRDVTIHARAMARAGVALVAVGAAGPVEEASYVAADLDEDVVIDGRAWAQEGERNEPPPSGAATASPVL